MAAGTNMYEHIAKIGVHGTRYAVAGPPQAEFAVLAVPFRAPPAANVHTHESARKTDLFLHCPWLIRACRKGAIRSEFERRRQSRLLRRRPLGSECIACDQ
jgi:hypothetical protein